MHPSTVPLKAEARVMIVGSSSFGRYPEISNERTYNCLITDGALVQTPGYKKRLTFLAQGDGRGIYSSARGNFMISIIANVVYRVSGPRDNLTTQEILRLESFFGDVSIDENIASEVAICDGQDLWIYNFLTGASIKASLPINPETGSRILPGYVTYHDGYFIVPDKTSNRWYLSQLNQGLNWFWGASSTPVFGAVQTKPDNAVAVLRAPGQGNLIYVFGRNVTEMWYDNGGALFPYQRSNSLSVDYGVLNSATIAALDNNVAWLGVNEKSGPVIMIGNGTNFSKLSTDGIDFQLGKLANPDKAYGFFYRIDGHVIYQITFYDPLDNFSLIYDFNTQAFFFVTDENMNYHIAESVAFFNDTYYFTSIRDNSIYELNSDFTQYDYTDPDRAIINPTQILCTVPRRRICNTISLDDSARFIANAFTFAVEMGEDPGFPQLEMRYLAGEDGTIINSEEQEGFIGDFTSGEFVLNNYVPRIDLSISKDGGETFGNKVSKSLNPLGKRKNRVVFWRLGDVNDSVFRLDFWSNSKFIISNGLVESRVPERDKKV